MPPVDVNYVHLFVAALIPMIIGALWYSPVLFADQWMKLTGNKTMGDMANPTKSYVLTFIGAIIESYVLIHILSYAGSTTLMDGASLGLWLAIGFIVPTFGADFIFGNKARQLYWITVGYYSVSLIVMGAVLAAWH